MAGKVFQRTSNAFQGLGDFTFETDESGPTATHYGVTAGGNSISVKDGVTHLAAHGVGGNTSGNEPIEGIPYDVTS